MRLSLGLVAAPALLLGTSADQFVPPILSRTTTSLLSIRADQNAGNRAGIASLAITNDRQSYYTLVKTGDLFFRVALDTGSSDLWITSSSCSTSACKAIPRFPLDRYRSSTFVSVNDNKTTFRLGYADGTSASGFLARETIQIANMSLPEQIFGVATQTDIQFKDQNSGVLGLGFPRLSTMSKLTTNSTPFFSRLAEQGQLQYPLFGVSLTRRDTGSIAIGSVDGTFVTNKTIPQIGWNPVVEFAPIGTQSNVSSYLHWAIPLGGIYVNGSSVTLSPSFANLTANSSLALMDIGTPGIYGPFSDVSRLFSLIRSSRLVDSTGQWAIPCDTRVVMTFTFGSQNYTLQPSDYLMGPTAGNPELCLSWPRAVAPSSDGLDWQMGSPFLRTVYSIFSYGINAKESPFIGLLSLKNATGLTESTTDVKSFLSAQAVTLATTLPNFPLATPTPTTPAYVFNTSIPAPTGGIVLSELATSTYRALFSEAAGIAPIPTLVTFVITDTAGTPLPSSSNAPSVTLGVPGWEENGALHPPTPTGLWLALLVTFSVMLGSHCIYS